MSQQEEGKGFDFVDFIDAIWWAGALVWAGVVLMAESLGYLPQIGEAGAWSWIFFGAGVLALLLTLVRAVSPSPNYRGPKTSDFIITAVLLIIGVSDFIRVGIGFALILVVVGLAILVSTLARR